MGEHWCSREKWKLLNASFRALGSSESGAAMLISLRAAVAARPGCRALAAGIRPGFGTHIFAVRDVRKDAEAVECYAQARRGGARRAVAALVAVGWGDGGRGYAELSLGTRPAADLLRIGGPGSGPGSGWVSAEGWAKGSGWE